jgi:hypothetical protein
MRRSPAATIAAFLAQLGVCRALSVVARARASRSTANANAILRRPPPVARPANSDPKDAPLVAELSRPVFAEPSAAPAKRNVSLRFDAALLSKVDAAAKRQGITRTAWLHCAAFDALAE